MNKNVEEDFYVLSYILYVKQSASSVAHGFVIHLQINLEDALFLYQHQQKLPTDLKCSPFALFSFLIDIFITSSPSMKKGITFSVQNVLSII